MGSTAPSFAEGPVIGTDVLPASEVCGAGQLQGFVGGPSSAVMALTDLPRDTRHYGSEEAVVTDTRSRLNFVHSGSAIDAVMNPGSRVIRVVCG